MPDTSPEQQAIDYINRQCDQYALSLGYADYNARVVLDTCLPSPTWHAGMDPYIAKISIFHALVQLQTIRAILRPDEYKAPRPT